jgi:hypothetical protein
MFEDPIIEEIRKVRHEHAAKFNNDLAAICEDLRRMERESGRTYVSFPPKRIGPDSSEARIAAAMRERRSA